MTFHLHLFLDAQGEFACVMSINSDSRIPPTFQVSLTSVDEPGSSTTLLFGSAGSSQESLLEKMPGTGDETEATGGTSPVSVPTTPETARRRSANSAPGSPNNTAAAAPKRGNSEVDRRKMSMAQRRQSTVQVRRLAVGFLVYFMWGK